MRVLLTAAPSIGHVVPMLGVAAALRDAGHEVRLAAHPSVHTLARREGLDVVAAGIDETDMMADRVRRWPHSHGQPPGVWGVRMFTQILAPPMADDLLPVLRDWRPQLLIHEEGEYAGPAVAALAGVPCVTHGWGSPLRSVEELGALELDAASLWEHIGVAMPPAAGLYRSGLLNPCPPFLQADAPAARTTWPVRPTHLGPAAADRVPDSVGEHRRHLVYVGFGTVAHFADAPDEIRAAVSAVVATGLGAVVTTTDIVLRQELLDEFGGRVDVRPFVSLPDLLATCRLVVCHAGAGTVLAALASGVGLVLLPRGAPSQRRMAEACARAGLAYVVGDVHIGQAVADALSDDALTTRCAAAADDMAAMPTPASVVSELEALVG